VRGVSTFRHGRGFDIGRLAGLAGRDIGIDFGDGIQRFEDAAADRGSAPGEQALDRILQHFLIGRGRLDQLCKTGEGHQADLRVGALPLNERERRRFGRQQAIRLDVGGAHAARDIHGEHDGNLPRRHGDDGHRSTECKHQTEQRGKEQRERNVTPPAGALRQCFTDQRKAGIAHSRSPPPAQHQNVGGDQQRNQSDQK